MTTSTTKALDYSFARPDPARIRRDGYTAVIRYLAPLNPNTRGKIIDLREAAALRRAGLDLVLNWEWYESRATEGAAAGHQDGRAARLMAHALGYPAGGAIYFSCDTDTHDVRHTNAYFAAARAALGPYRMGAYGGYDLVLAAHRAKVVDLSWQTVAWSHGQWHAASVLRQTGQQVYGGGADVNLVTGAYYGWDARRWRTHPPAHPATHPPAYPATHPPAHPAAAHQPAPAVHTPAIPPAHRPVVVPAKGAVPAAGAVPARTAVPADTAVPAAAPPGPVHTAPAPVTGPPHPAVPGPATAPAPGSPAGPGSALSAAAVAAVIDERMSYWLPRLAVLLRRGAATTAFGPANAGSLVDGVGLDGLVRTAATTAARTATAPPATAPAAATSSVFFAAVDVAGRRLDGHIWMDLGSLRARVPSPALWLALNPSETLREVTPDHPFFALPVWPESADPTVPPSSSNGADDE